MSATQKNILEKLLREWFILFAQKSKETSKQAGKARFLPIILNYKHSLKNDFVKEMKPPEEEISDEYFLRVAHDIVELGQTQFGSDEPTIEQIASLATII